MNMQTATNRPDVIALHWGSDGIETVSDPKRARELYAGKSQHQMHWGADTRDDTLDIGGPGDRNVRFHPGRDYRWGKNITAARMEWNGLRAAGIPLKSDLFRGEAGFDDLDRLWDIVDGQSPAMRAKGIDAHWLLDAAPNIFVAEETIRQTG